MCVHKIIELGTPGSDCKIKWCEKCNIIIKEFPEEKFDRNNVLYLNKSIKSLL
jgi:hypothetical protein